MPTPRAVVCGRTLRAGCVLVLHEVDHPLVQVRAPVALGQPEAHRTAAAPTDLAHQRHLGTGVVVGVVVALAEAHRALEHTGAVFAEHLGKGEQFVGGRRRCPAPGGRRGPCAGTCGSSTRRAHRPPWPRRPVGPSPRCRRRSPAPRRDHARPSRRCAAPSGRRGHRRSDPWGAERSSRSTRRRSPSPRRDPRGSRRRGCPRRSPSSRPASPDRRVGTARM